MRPAWTDAVLTRLLPGPVGEALLGDLDEEYRTHVLAERGRLRAGIWYWRQVALSIPRARRATRMHTVHRGAGVRAGTGGGFEALVKDLAYALRGLRSRPGFTAVALATLALGIGANTAIFSVVDGVVLRPLPYQEPDRLVRVWPEFLLPFELRSALEFKEASQVYEDMSVFGRGLFTLTGDGDPEIARGGRVLANHFALLGVQPALGRGFVPEEGTENGQRAVVLSHGLWQRRYGADPDILGRTIDLGGDAHVVVGVAASDHQPLESDWQLWVPIRVSPAALDGGGGMAVNGRLRPGATVAEAQDEARRLYAERRRIEGAEATPDELADLTVVPLREWMVGETGTRLLVLLGAVASVLLIAAANVANLLLALGGARTRELAVRRALGAGRGRIVRQLLTEAAVLGVLGGVLGVLGGHAALAVGAPHLPAEIPRVQEVGIDGRVLAFALALSLGSALVFGLVPALRATASAASDGLADGVRGTAGRRQLRLNQGLVAAEVALAVVLVTGAGLMLRSFWQLNRVDPGFEPAGVLSLRLSPPADLEGPEEIVAFHQEVLDRVGRVPGVRSVGAIQFLPMRPGGWWSRYRVEGVAPPPERDMTVAMRVVTPAYFATMGIAVEAGRAFAGEDRAETAPVIIVNQALARSAWPGEDPVGRILMVGVDQPAPYRVVGVVEDVRQAELQTDSHPEAYLPLSQWPWWSLFYAVRVDGDPAAAAPAVRRAIWSVDDGAPISSVAPLDDVVGATVAETRFFTGLLTAFGGLALLLGAVGVYGVMSYVVSLQSRDIGIRIALGAASGRVLSGTLRRGLMPVALGLVLGMGAALVVGRVLEGTLYQVEATDPATLVAVPLVLMGAALVALYLPARRASRLDPMRVLRND